MTQPNRPLSFPEALLAIAEATPLASGKKRAAVIDAIRDEYGIDADPEPDIDTAAPVLHEGESLNPALDADELRKRDNVYAAQALSDEELEAELARRKTAEG